MNEPHLIESLVIEGFRAYLQPKTFDFTSKKCIAIFAPNGSGKSSLVDALEFILSKDGTLERLGQRAVNNQAGPLALAHYQSVESGISPSVSIRISAGSSISSGMRTASGSARPIPDVARRLNEELVVSPIIRGHALRTFVEAHSPEQRYIDVANWLQLGPLVEVQKNLRALRTQVKAATEDLTHLKLIDTHVSKETGQIVMAWDSADILAYVNQHLLAPLDESLVLEVLAVDDLRYTDLEARATLEAKSIGLAGLRQLARAVDAIVLDDTEAKNSGQRKGTILAFNEAIQLYSAAESKEIEERRKDANTDLQDVWRAAELLFVENSHPPDSCPVCTTRIVDTAAGSVPAIHLHLTKGLEELAVYTAARKALLEAKTAVSNTHAALKISLQSLIDLQADDGLMINDQITAYHGAIVAWASGPVPDSAAVLAELDDIHSSLRVRIDEIESTQGEHTYIKAKEHVDRLIEHQTTREHVLRTRNELKTLYSALSDQSVLISAEIRSKVQGLLDHLQRPANDIYQLIQGSGAAHIRLELPSEDDANQQRLNLLIDFAPNRNGVQPAGYLSDSQIHSVALALRMAAIKMFNTTAPILVLDDIVTSYDADHRRAIASMIAAVFAEHQIILTTHDERFFNFLKDQLLTKTWHFTRIIGIDPSFGPRFADHKVSDEMIEARWSEGNSSANEMRQAEEEWLLGVCRDFGVSVRIRPLDKAYSYERSELASALAGFLKSAKLVPNLVPGVKNRFLDSLARGEIENFGSHFQDTPYGVGSIGDEQLRWVEFSAFRSQFVCKSCSRTRFQRPITINNPICAHASCEAKFEF